MNDKMNIPIDVALTFKAAGENGTKGDWIVEGHAATSDVDLVGDVLSPEALEAAANDLIERSTVLYNHRTDEPIGKVLKVKLDKSGLWIRAKISKTVPELWEKIREGVLNKFSIRGKILDAVKRFDVASNRVVNYVRAMKLLEVSVVSVPINSAAQTVSAYVKKAMEDFEVENPEVIQKDPLDAVLDKMEEKGLLGDEIVAETVKADTTVLVDESEQATDVVPEPEETAEVPDPEPEPEPEVAEEVPEEETPVPAETSTVEDVPAKETAAEPEVEKADKALKNCKFFKKADCPVTETPSPGKLPAEARSCEMFKSVVCPYQTAVETFKEEKRKATEENRRQAFKTKLRELVVAAVKQAVPNVVAEFGKGLEEEIGSLTGKIDALSVLMEGKLKDIESRNKELSKSFSTRKSLNEPERPDMSDKKEKDDVWKGCLPY